MNDINIPKRKDLRPDLCVRLREDGRNLCKIARTLTGSYRESNLLDKLYERWQTYPQNTLDTALYYLVEELLAGARETREFSLTLEGCTEHPNIGQNGAAEILHRVFFDEAVSAFRHACAPARTPWIGEYLPSLPEGDEYRKFGARLFRQLLDEYCAAREKYNHIGDLATECWEQMPDRLRRREYIREFCKCFGFPPPGRTIKNKYKLETIVGIGGMGIVYRAAMDMGMLYQEGEKKPKYRVALKMLRSDCACREKFAREGQTTVRLTDRRFVIVKDVELGADVEFPFFTMDYVEGGRSLRDLIDHGERFTEPDLAATCRILSELVYPGKSGSERNLATTKHQFQSRSRLFAGIVCHVAKAIHDLHQGGNGYLHCDLKPGNILISKKNGPLIGDLGLSRAMKGGYTNKESFTGTPAYSSPEQAAGNALTVQSDVYQLGAVLFRCLTGRAPFHRNSKGESDLSLLQRVQTEDIVPPSQINREVDRDLEAICMKALSKLPAQRYSSAGDMTADLLRYLKGEPVHARPGFRRREIIRTCLRSVWSYLFIGLVLSGLIGWSAYNNYQHEAFLNHQEVDGCVASTNRYRALDLVPPPQIEVLPIRDHRSAACLVGVLASPSGSSSLQAASLLGSGLLEGWPNPDYSHVIIKSSSAYFDLSRWKPIPPGTSPATADRSQGEPALYTRVIDLERKVSVSQERPKVSFQLRTEGYDVDLKCVTHPYRILGSPAREPLGGGVKPVLIREVEVDLSAVPNGELTRVVIHGTIWNGFQRTPPPLHCAVALLMPLPWAVFANAIVADDSRQWAAFLAPDALSEGELAVKFPRNLKPRQSPKLFFFKKGSPKQEEPIGTQNFHDPRDKDWWVWRPRDIRRDHVYQIEWSWKPTPSP